LPTGMTGSPIVDNYLAKALPNLAGAEANALVTGKPLGDVGIASLLNTGMNMGTNALIDQAMPNTLSPTQQQWASGIGSGLLKSAITGQPIDVSESSQNTAMQQALQMGRKG